MNTEDLPQIYLVTPSVIDLDHYPAQLARVLDTVEVACLRLGLSSGMKTTLPAPQMHCAILPMRATSCW